MQLTEERLTKFLSKLSQEDIRRVQVCSLREQFNRYDELAENADDLAQTLIVAPGSVHANFEKPRYSAGYYYDRKEVLYKS